MKPRNFEASPLTPDEFSMTLIECTDQDVTAYLRWIAEELNRRGLTISRGLADQLAELAGDDNTDAAQ